MNFRFKQQNMNTIKKVLEELEDDLEIDNNMFRDNYNQLEGSLFRNIHGKIWVLLDEEFYDKYG